MLKEQEGCSGTEGGSMVGEIARGSTDVQGLWILSEGAQWKVMSK